MHHDVAYCHMIASYIADVTRRSYVRLAQNPVSMSPVGMWQAPVAAVSDGGCVAVPYNRSSLPSTVNVVMSPGSPPAGVNWGPSKVVIDSLRLGNLPVKVSPSPERIWFLAFQPFPELVPFCDVPMASGTSAHICMYSRIWLNVLIALPSFVSPIISPPSPSQTGQPSSSPSLLPSQQGTLRLRQYAQKKISHTEQMRSNNILRAC